MTLQKGDFILINYVGKVKETNEVFDTTLDEVAKKEHLHREGDIYEPKLVIIGEGWMLKTLDESFLTMETDKQSTVEITSDKAFGQRDPEKVRRVPLKQLLAKQINPVVGARIDYNGKMAVVRSIGAGRVLLDFNPPLAGRTLVYDATVTKKLEALNDKISALIHRRIPGVEESKFKLSVAEQSLTIDMPEETFYIEGIQIAKRGIAMDIQKYIMVISEVKFIETFKTEVPKVEPKQEATPGESKQEEPKQEESKQEETKT